MDYGDYAIGMNKNWVEHNGLNPVNYINFNSTLESTLTKPISTSEEELYVQNRKVLNSILEVYRYHKPYEGVNEKLNKDNYRFYDEREWRYIPSIKSDNGFREYLTLDEYEEYKKSHINKPHLTNIKLKIKSSDIDYIIVKSENDIFPLIEFLENQQNLGSPKEIKLLTTRIITKEQIEKDF